MMLKAVPVTGGAEWLQTGTLVFHGTTANPLRGKFYYNRAEDVPEGPFGFAIPVPGTARRLYGGPP